MTTKIKYLNSKNSAAKTLKIIMKWAKIKSSLLIFSTHSVKIWTVQEIFSDFFVHMATLTKCYFKKLPQNPFAHTFR